jgi:hypothetical protein
MENFFSQLVLSDDTGYRTGRHFLFWMAAWAFQGFIYGFYFVNGDPVNHFSISFIESAIFLPQHIMLSCGIIYFLLPQFIFKGKYWQGFLGVVILIVVAAILSPVINKYIS